MLNISRDDNNKLVCLDIFEWCPTIIHKRSSHIRKAEFEQIALRVIALFFVMAANSTKH